MFRNGRPSSSYKQQQANVINMQKPTMRSSTEYEYRNDELNNSKAKSNGHDDLRNSSSFIKNDFGKLNQFAPKKSKDEHLNFHYIGEEDEDNENEKEARSVMLEEDEDMEVLSVNDQEQSMKDFGSTSSSRISYTSAKSNNNNNEVTISRDSLPLKRQKERDLRDSISSHQSSGGKSVNSSRESRKSSPRFVEKPISTSSRPARIAEYIKRFRTAPPTNRSDRKGLDSFDRSETNILDEILPYRKEKVYNGGIEDDISMKKSLEYMDFNVNEIDQLTRMALERGNEKNLDSILSKSASKSEKSILSEPSDDLDEMFRQSVLSRLQSIGLHESYLDPNSYDIIGNEDNFENDAVSKVEELIKERNLVENMINRDGKIKQSVEMKETSKVNEDSKRSLEEIPFESKQIQFMDEEELLKKLGVGNSTESIVSANSTKEEIDINDDENELFMNDYICKSLKQKIEQLRQHLSEVERKYALLE